eukprot:510316-Pelagomonas_calceolata.AAC.4
MLTKAGVQLLGAPGSPCGGHLRQVSIIIVSCYSLRQVSIIIDSCYSFLVLRSARVNRCILAFCSSDWNQKGQVQTCYISTGQMRKCTGQMHSCLYPVAHAWSRRGSIGAPSETARRLSGTARKLRCACRGEAESHSPGSWSVPPVLMMLQASSVSHAQFPFQDVQECRNL